LAWCAGKRPPRKGCSRALIPPRFVPYRKKLLSVDAVQRAPGGRLGGVPGRAAPPPPPGGGCAALPCAHGNLPLPAWVHGCMLKCHCKPRPRGDARHTLSSALLRPAPQAAAQASMAAAVAPTARRAADPFVATCNTRKWGQSKKLPFNQRTEFCCAHWGFDKRKSQKNCDAVYTAYKALASVVANETLAAFKATSSTSGQNSAGSAPVGAGPSRLASPRPVHRVRAHPLPLCRLPSLRASPLSCAHLPPFSAALHHSIPPVTPEHLLCRCELHQPQ
jgi:hypothetical protein